jgi:hypothetical protein
LYYIYCSIYLEMFNFFHWAEFDIYVIDMFHILWSLTCIWITWNENKMEWNGTDWNSSLCPQKNVKGFWLSDKPHLYHYFPLVEWNYKMDFVQAVLNKDYSDYDFRINPS